MKRWHRKLQRLAALVAAVLLYAGVCPVPAGAVAYETSVCGDRNLVQEEIDGGRTFRLNYRVWTDERASRAAGPSDILLLLDTSASMGFLADSPRENTCYRPGLSYAGKIGEKTVLYTESEGNMVPAALSGSIWKTMEGTKVGERRGQQDRFTQTMYEKGSCRTRMEQAQAAVRKFLEKLGQESPGSRAGVVFFGDTVTSTGLREAEEKYVADLMSQVSVCTPQNSDTRKYASALEQAADEVEKLSQEQALSVISIACGDRDSEDDGKVEGVDKSLHALQRIRNAGGRTYSILMEENPGEEAEKFWSSMASVPLDTHFHLCRRGETEGCLEQVYQSITSAFSVTVVQELDPRFTLSQQECDRLTQEGAVLEKLENGSWRISWKAELPKSIQTPWTTGVTVEAQEDFPGGNSVALDGEGSGIYRFGKRIESFPAASANVPLLMDVRDLETTLFLGEKIPCRIGGTDVEEAMLRSRTPNWYGKGQTGTFSYRWEKEDGSAVGSLQQLAGISPPADENYRFRVAYHPGSQGEGSVGKPVEETEASSLYRVHVVSGTVKVKVSGTGFTKDSAILFRLEKDGTVLYREARAEADPQNGSLSLETEFAGLPYGTYTVTPESSFGAVLAKGRQGCLVGTCTENDTVDPQRRTALVKFTAAAGSARQSRSPYQLVFKDGGVS